MYRRQLLACAIAPCVGSAARAASDLPAPSAAVVLSIGGRVNRPNRGARAEFDMPMLERLPQISLMPGTPWYGQPRRFTGPLLREVLAAAGAQGSRLRALALNDYAVELPMDDVQRYDVVLARLLDDKPMSVRDKGPLFIMYPFERHSELRSSVYYSRCAWQLRAIEVA